MKSWIIILAFAACSFAIHGQTAEEIIYNTEQAYRKLDNYVDQGVRTSILFVKPLFHDTSTYQLAMDREQNIYFSIHTPRSMGIKGATYTKVAGDSMGVYTRHADHEIPFSCSFYEAGGRLGGTGGYIFFLTASLMYPDYTWERPGNGSSLQGYDEVTRLEDAKIGNQSCYVIQTLKTIVVPQELVDKRNHQQDSIQGMLDLPPEQRGGYHLDSRPRVFGHLYYIRKSDFLIVKIVDRMFEDDILMSESQTLLHPEYNVKDFQSFLDPAPKE